MFCGIRSFSHVDVDDGGSWASSPRRKSFKLRKKKSLSVLGRSSAKKNPYSATGLDKFEKLLAELEAEKKKILLRKEGGSGEDTVRFRYRSNNDEEWIPIVIKRPQPPVPAKRKKKKKKKAAGAAAEEVGKLQEVQLEAQVGTSSSIRRRLRSSVVPCWAVVVVAVLLCMVFGRAFAVSWAAILWYMLPMIPWSRTGWTTVQDPNIKRIPM